MRNLELFYKLNIQLFAENDGEEESTNHEESNLEDENKDSGFSKKEKDNGDGKNNDDETITMTKKQLSDRLRRQKNNTTEEMKKELSSIVSETVAKILQEQKEQKDFESMKDDEKKEYLDKKKEKELAERERKLDEQLKIIAEKESKEIIMNAYDEDKLPCRDIFSSKIAPYIARLEEEDKIIIYNGIKDIIESVKTTSFNNALKQNPPRNGDTNSSSFKSDRFIKAQNKEMERKRNNQSGDRWGF